MEPGSSDIPVACDGRARNLHYIRRLVEREAAEISKLDDPNLLIVDAFKPVESLVQCQQVEVNLGRFGIKIGERDFKDIPAAFFTLFCTGMIDQYVAHNFRRKCKKPRATVPTAFLVVYKANVRFVDKCRGLKRVSGTLAAKINVRQAVKFIINERE